jgi:lysozyme
MTALKIVKAICKIFEGFRSKPYLCPAKVATIGYGTTRYPTGEKVRLTDRPITESEGEEYLNYEAEKAIIGALKYCPILAQHPQKLGAIADFCYNLGIGRLQMSTLRRKINEEDWDGAVEQLNKWVYASGRKLNGLVKRREAESVYFKM